MQPIFYQWIALSLLFVASTIWSEDNVRFGYVLVPFLAGFFYWAGFLNYVYLGTIIPLVMVMGVITYLRSHLKYKYGVFGSSGGLLVKIVVFLIILQMAIGYVNGLGIFQTAYAPTPSNDYTLSYNLSTAQKVYAGQTTGIDVADTVANTFSIIWIAWRVMWGIISAIFYVYGPLTTIFHVDMATSALIQCGMYLLYGLTVFTLIFKPYQPVEL
jgi:hypothetical protein